MGEVVTVNLLFFAKSRELVGLQTAKLNLPQKATGRHILKHIVGEFPSCIMDIVDIVDGKLSVDEISFLVSSPSCGAVSVFIGTTRDSFGDNQVVRLDYEAYMPMAKRKMLEVCASIRQRWNVHKIAIIHRIGVVPVKEASIIIAISSVHRNESLEAVHYAIDTVKAEVPIWKKEIYADESSSWKQNKEWARGYELPANDGISNPLFTSAVSTNCTD